MARPKRVKSFLESFIDNNPDLKDEILADVRINRAKQRELDNMEYEKGRVRRLKREISGMFRINIEVKEGKKELTDIDFIKQLKILVNNF